MFLLGILLLTSDANGTDYNMTYEWQYKVPKIMICKDSNTKKDTIKKAKKYWQKKGYSIGNIVNEKNNECSDELEYGYILIEGQKKLNTTKYFGLTYPWTNKSNKIVSTVTYIDKRYANNLNLITHELGHALGLKHSKDKSNIMHESGKMFD